MELKINYEQACKNYYTQAKEALQKYLELDSTEGQGFIISAQALNPFLRTLETINEKGVVVLPLSAAIKIKYGMTGANTNELYMIIKVPLVNYQVGSIQLTTIY
jgi:hypothetical protein